MSELSHQDNVLYLWSKYDRYVAIRQTSYSGTAIEDAAKGAARVEMELRSHSAWECEHGCTQGQIEHNGSDVPCPDPGCVEQHEKEKEASV